MRIIPITIQGTVNECADCREIGMMRRTISKRYRVRQGGNLNPKPEDTRRSC